MENKLKRGLVISQVAVGGIGDELDLTPGDRIDSINGIPVRDVIDFYYLMAGEKVVLDVTKKGNENWELEIEKNYDDTLGIDFELPIGKIRSCGNNCVFCFVDQMPLGLRESLYIKDDDYRLSFLQGNFITLTNLGEKELKRIVEQHLSPLYISVHTTDKQLRQKMMGSKRAGEILTQLEYLVSNGIEIHAQVVLCPGLNDGEQLQKTITDLASLWPEVRSIALVPVGLTMFREGLYALKGYTPSESREIISAVKDAQDNYSKEYNYPLVFAADEFYLNGNVVIPAYNSYGGFPQVENGVGITRLFLEEWVEVSPSMPSSLPLPRSVTLITGRLGRPVLDKIVAALSNVGNLTLNLLTAENELFGSSVTVAGLLAGHDILRATRDRELGDALILPLVLFKDEGDLFLDGVSVKDIESELKLPVLVARGPRDLIKNALGGCV